MTSARPVGASSDVEIDTVVVVDPRPLIAEAVASLIGEVLESFVVVAVRDPADAPGEPSVAIAPVPHDAEHIEMAYALLAAGHRVLTYGPLTRGAALAAEAGSWGHLDHRIGTAELVAAIQTVAAGRAVFGHGERSELIAGLRLERSAWHSDGLTSLTRREVEVLHELCRGRRPAEIAEDNFVSVRTVRNQIQSILTKLNVHSQLEAVALATRHPVFTR